MIFITITEKECGLFSQFSDLKDISDAILKRLFEIKFLIGWHKGFTVEVSVDSFVIKYKGITQRNAEISGYLARCVMHELQELQLSDICYVSSTGAKDYPQDTILDLNSFHPGQTKNSILLNSILPFDKVPEEYLCSLSKEIMDEPVHTVVKPDILYNKKHLTFWLYSKPVPEDPFTRIRINPIQDVIANPTQQQEINAFVHDNLKAGLLAKKRKITDIIKKHTGQDIVNQLLIDKTFRTAAAKNDVHDLQVLHCRVSSINAQDDNPQRKRTALHWAIDKKALECVKWLLEKKADLDIPNAQGLTARHLITSSNDPEIKNLLNVELIQPLNDLHLRH